MCLTHLLMIQKLCENVTPKNNTPNIQLEDILCACCGGNDTTKLIKTYALHKGRCYGLLCRVVICKSCGLAYLNPRMSAEDYREFYLNEYWQLNTNNLAPVASRHSDLAQKILEFFSTNIPSDLNQDLRILDIGCGTGETLNHLVQKTHATGYGIEPSESVARWASEKHGHTIIQKDFFDNQLPDNQFDLIVASAVMEHFLEPFQGLREIKRLIKPGGLLFIRVPDLERCDFHHSSTAKIFKVVHTYYFTKDTLSTLLSKAGFEIVRIERMPIQPGESQGEIWVLAKDGQIKLEHMPQVQSYRQILVSVYSARLRGLLPYWYMQSKKRAKNSVRNILRRTLPANLYNRLRKQAGEKSDAHSGI